MAIEIFNRYEKKYMMDEITCSRIQKRLLDYMEPDAYNKQHETYAISNIYYDTEDSELIRNSLAKPKYKEKLRLRAYGVPSMDDKVYVEIKKKFRGLVNKRRSSMKLNEAYAFLSADEGWQLQPYMNAQVLNEAQYLMAHTAIKPALYLAYDRRAYFGVGQHDLRVSFDTNIRTRRTDLRLEDGDWGEQLLTPGRWLMEIKVAQSIPLWLCRLLSEYEIYSQSFSKYGTEYTKTLTERRQGAPIIQAPENESVVALRTRANAMLTS